MVRNVEKTRNWANCKHIQTQADSLDTSKTAVLFEKSLRDLLCESNLWRGDIEQTNQRHA